MPEPAVQRRGQENEPPPEPKEMGRILLRFALIEGIGALALLGFLVAFFVYDRFPGQPMPLLLGAILAFFGWGLFAMWASGFVRLLTKR